MNTSYDRVTEFNIKTNRFECAHCGTPMEASQGYFADEGTPAATRATAFECPKCGHTLSAHFPAYALSQTDDDDDYLWTRIQAAHFVANLFLEFEAYYQALYDWQQQVIAWEAEQKRKQARERRFQYRRGLGNMARVMWLTGIH